MVLLSEKNNNMKKLTLLFSLMALFAVTQVQAQKACCSSKSKTAAACSKDSKAATKTASADYEMAAAKLASLDGNIERKVCPESGTVSYLKKETCEESGKVSLVNVEYSAEVGEFVNVSPSALHGEKTASAKSASDKACCADGKKADCCADGKKASKSKKMEKTKVKLLKSTSGSK